MDYTFIKYHLLLQTLHSQGFFFYTVREYFEDKASDTPFIMLRHDVESKYENALRFARMQHEMGIKGTYYIRIRNKPGNEDIIKEIVALGHEIGYHYDDLSACNGNFEMAYDRFTKNLSYLRSFAEVKTMTMEGAPLSRYDNRKMWNNFTTSPSSYTQSNKTYQTPNPKPVTRNTEHGTPNPEHGTPNPKPETRNPKPETQNPEHQTRNTEHGTPNPKPGTPNPEPDTRNPEHETRNPKPGTRNTEHGTPNTKQKTLNYHNFGILAEPYFDLDFNKIFYLTDTGRRWDGWKTSVRDKVKQQEEWIKQGLVFHSTSDIIQAANEGRLPDKIMMTFHPQRWNDRPLPWLKELLWQSTKNVGKRILIQIKKDK